MSWLEQTEEGRRVGDVTGVQPCALPTLIPRLAIERRLHRGGAVHSLVRGIKARALQLSEQQPRVVLGVLRDQHSQREARHAWTHGGTSGAPPILFCLGRYRSPR